MRHSNRSWRGGACATGVVLLSACSSSNHVLRNDGGALADATGLSHHDGGHGSCVPTTCASLKVTCGANPDGCGATLSCGTCDAPESCGGGGVSDVCGIGTCHPRKCTSAGATCGMLSDGCGNVVSCGACSAPATCGGGGKANVCGGGEGVDGGGGAPDASPSGLTFAIDLQRGPNRVFNPPAAPVAVSPYVYGVNSFAAWEQKTKWGMLRWGGDGMTDWNWTNNYSNAGADFCFAQLNSSGIGAANTLAGKVVTGTPSVASDQMIGAASLVTVPILDFVASKAVTNNVYGTSNPPCPGTAGCSGGGAANGYAENVANLPFPSSNPSSDAFVTNNPTKGGALCTATTGSCSVDTSGSVYQDEFVNFMKVTYGTGAPVFFMLDNEPNYWPSVHPEVYPNSGVPGCGTSGTVSFDDIVTRDSTYARAIKATWPDAKVFGPVVAQDGILYAGDYSDTNLPTPFGQYYLAKMAAASSIAGHALIDSFDTHYYTKASLSGGNVPATPDQCLNEPRLFWDPTFTEYTAAEVGLIDFGYDNNLIDSALYPREMIPRMLGWIATAYAGNSAMAPGYSISEYDMGCETQIEGGVAEADLLGVFGREGLFGATMWPLGSITNGSGTALVNYPVAAFDLYRNYDGHGSVVGNTTVYATTTDVADTSVYAFTGNANEVDVVAINKLSAATNVSIAIAHAPSLTTAKAYNLVDGTIGVTAVASAPTVACSGGACTFRYTMPATSATTLVLK